MRRYRVDNSVDGGLFFGRVSRRRIAVIAEAVAPVKPRGADMEALEWLFRASEDRNFRIA